MKQITLFTLCIFSFFGLSAQTSNIVIFCEGGERFYLMINAQRQNNEPQTNVKVQGLMPGAYKAKLVFENTGVAIPDLDKTLYTEAGMEYTYNVKKKDAEYVMRILSQVPLAQALPPAPTTYVVTYGAPPPTAVVVAPAGGVVQQTTTTTTTTTGGATGAGVNMGMNVDGVGMNMNINISDPTMMGTGTSTTYSQTTTTTTGGAIPPPQQTVVYVPGYSGPIGCPMPMAPGDFMNAKNSIQSKDFESTKLDIAKQIVGSNCLTAQQVKEVVQLFDFESSKLDFAKFAYGHTYDRSNYYVVNDAFDFESSVTELVNFTGGH